MDELHRVAIERALSILAADRELPGSEEEGNLEAARQILAGDKLPTVYEITKSAAAGEGTT